MTIKNKLVLACSLTPHFFCWVRSKVQKGWVVKNRGEKGNIVSLKFKHDLRQVQNFKSLIHSLLLEALPSLGRKVMW